MTSAKCLKVLGFTKTKNVSLGCFYLISDKLQDSQQSPIMMMTVVMETMLYLIIIHYCTFSIETDEMYMNKYITGILPQ